NQPGGYHHIRYPFWSGELFNRGRASAAERVEIDVSHNALAGGLLCADGYSPGWRRDWNRQGDSMTGTINQD
ncbi:hypothetical protein ACUOCP_57900, partial [Escherichia sp. R-CC3]